MIIGTAHLRGVVNDPTVRRTKISTNISDFLVNMLNCPIEKDGIGILNDNYCDCISSKGPSDENMTSACSWYTSPAIPLYFCSPYSSKSIAYYSKLKLNNNINNNELIGIYSSRINDGICDCKDCRDEM